MRCPLVLLVALGLASVAEAQTLSTLIVPPETVTASELSAADVDSVFALETRMQIARGRGQDAVADSLRAAIRALVPPPVLPYARVYADGTARSGVTGSSGGGATTGTLGVQVQTRLLGTRADAAFRISVLGAADSVISDYGHALLAPASGATLDAGIADVRFLDVLAGIDVRAYGSVSTSNWSVTTDSTGFGFDPSGPAQPVEAGVLGVGLLLSETLVQGIFPSDTPVAVAADVGVALRRLIGDVAGADRSALRDGLFGTDRRTFIGFEAGLGIQVAGVKAGLTYYYFPDDVDGLGNGQVVAGIGIETALIKGVIAEL